CSLIVATSPVVGGISAAFVASIASVLAAFALIDSGAVGAEFCSLPFGVSAAWDENMPASRLMRPNLPIAQSPIKAINSAAAVRPTNGQTLVSRPARRYSGTSSGDG